MPKDSKPPMFGPSATFDPATYEPRSGKSFWMGGSPLLSALGSPREAGESNVGLEALTEKIQPQDRFIAELQADLQRAREASVERMLGQLRLREAVLLYVGQDVDKLIDDLSAEFDGDVVSAVSNSLFVLDNAPVPAEVRDAIRKATDHGMKRNRCD